MNPVALAGLFGLNQKTWAQIARSTDVPQSVKTMVYLHLQKPWVPNFLAVAISPLNGGLKEFLGPPVFEYNGLTFYAPSTAWWFAHARTSHPPDGQGCDAQTHASFLTASGGNAEFAYANVLKSGEVRILERQDFDDECAFWKAGNGA